MTLCTCAGPVVTSVGALPDVAEGGRGAVAAADDVDGAGGVDHGRVAKSFTPRRAGRTVCPRDTCGHVRATDRMTNANAAHAAVRPLQADL